MYRMWSAVISLLVTPLLAVPASASCLNFGGQNERLANYCLLESITGKLVDERTAFIVTQRLKQEGYFGGLSSPRSDTAVYPTMSYSNNINGGNPDKNLVIGELEFEGDPTLVATEGMILGANASASFRNTFSEGRYFDASLSAALNWSPKHGDSYTTGRVAGCFKNKVKRAGYADFCFESSEQKKDISSDRSKSISFNFGHLGFANDFGFTDTSVGFKRNFHYGYQEDQVSLQLQTIHPQNVFSSVRVRMGERVQNQMTLKYGLDVRLSTTLAGRPVTLALGRERNDGGKLLGVDRTDTVNRISASMPLNNRLSVSAGYQETRSSIQYFSSKEPSLSVKLSW